MTTFVFKSADFTNEFTAYLNKKCCIDISAQTYKADCPPVALTKLPLISSRQTIDFVIAKMNEALKKIYHKHVILMGNKHFDKSKQFLNKHPIAGKEGKKSNFVIFGNKDQKKSNRVIEKV